MATLTTQTFSFCSSEPFFIKIVKQVTATCIFYIAKQGMIQIIGTYE